MRGQDFARLGLTLVMACAGAEVASLVHMPLPWMLGSMMGVSLVSLADRTYRQPALARKAAQITIGMALGLYFTPTVLQQIANLAGWIAAGAAVAILLSMISARLLQRMAGFDGPTAIYSVALGASAEMSVQAQRAGADGAMVASAHAVRIIMVTSSASFIAWLSGGTPLNVLPGSDQLPLNMVGLILIGAVLTGLAFQRLRVPNPWVLGSLLIAGIAASHGWTGRLPDTALSAAQIVIGWGLGQNITRSFFTRAPRAMAAVAFVTVGVLAGCVVLALFISRGTGIPLITTFLSTAPGGMTEMGLISKMFGLGAPVVISFHILRVLCTIFLTRSLAAWMLKIQWVQVSAK